MRRSSIAPIASLASQADCRDVRLGAIVPRTIGRLRAI